MRQQTVIITANESWNLVNFRSGLIRALIDSRLKVVAAAPYSPGSVEQLCEMGCFFEPIPIDAAGVRPWRDLRTIRAYRRLIARYRPAAIISWTIKPNIYATWAAGRAGVASLPNVSGLGTAFMQPGFLRLVARQMYRHAFRRATAVFFQNSSDLNIFVADGLVEKDKAILLPGSGVDTEFFSPASAERVTPGYFLMISRLIADKGVREFAEAARTARQLRPNLRFAIMGQINVENRSAIGREELQSWLDEGIIEYIEPTEDVRPAIASADFVVLPSYREGMSRVLLESAAMARPTVTCDVPGCRDIVTDGENGFLCAPRDANALTNTILRAAALDDSEWLRMGRAGREVATEKFAEATVISAYREALCRSGVELG